MKKKSSKPKVVRKLRKAAYRILAKQPLSVEVSAGTCIEGLSIQGVPCHLAITPALSDPATQKELGGALIAIEYEDDVDTDLLVAGRNGFELIEDFLSAITLISGTTFQPSALLQVARLSQSEETCHFLQLLRLPLNHWHEKISDSTISAARGLLAHWDGLESGKRLRRAARRYRDAAGTFDDVAAFQEAYIGLEAMEPPLAKMALLTPGTEMVKGICEKCGHEFTRKRTSLVGVRAFVQGHTNTEPSDPQRKSDWKLINTLRNDLMHGLVDDKTLQRRPHDALMATMHYLYDATMLCSHAAATRSETYRLARGATDLVLTGRYSTASWSGLHEWTEIIKTSAFRWVPHATYGLVPEIAINNHGLKDLGIGFCRLVAPMSVATMRDLREARVEMD